VTGLGGTPTGTVTIMNGANLLCTITLSGGSGSCSVVFNTISSPALTAHYMGDMNYAGSISATVSGTVNPGTSVTTITSVVPNPSAVGGAVVVTVTVTGAGATPVGLVTVTTTGTTAPNPSSCTFTTVGGTGNCSLTYTATGTSSITATFTLDPNYNTSSATTSHAVN
jgi:hypothetical protein